MAAKRGNGTTLSRIWARENIITTVLGFFIVLSLLLHAATLLALVHVRDVVRLQLSTAATQVQEARQQQIHYDVPIKQSFPISTTIAISETFEVAINESFPIKETFNVPVDVGSVIPGMGSFDLPVPVNLTIPVSTTLKVPVRRQIPIATTIDVNESLPLSIDLKQPPMGDLLTRIEQSLRDLLSKL